MLKKLFLSILLISVICSPSLADEFKIDLVQGWNLKSARVAITVADTFSSAGSFASVWKWESGGWAVYLPGETTPGEYAAAKGFNPLTTISPGEGFWVNSKGTQTSVTIMGTPVDTDAIYLEEGWNLKGLKADSSIIVSSLFANATKFASVWKWESGGWAVYLPGEETQGDYAKAKGFSQISSITPGEGFWVNAAAAGAGELEPMPPLVASQVLDSTYSGKYVPVQGAEVYFNEVKIADTDINGSFGFGVFYGEVLDAQTGAGLEGVKISTDYGVTAVSLSNGAYLLPHPPGNFILKAALAGYNTFELATAVGSLGYTEVSISMAPQVSKKMTRPRSLHKGLYSVTQDIPISVKANGYQIENATLNLSAGLKDYLFIMEEEDVPEEKFEENNLPVVKGSFDVSTFKTYPNLFVLEVPPEAIPAAPTPKVFSDDKSAVIITKMKLEKDITVAVQTFGSKDIIEDITFIEEAAQSSYIIGGADVLISTVEGIISSEDAGFSARVRAVTKENLSASAMSFAQMKTAIDSGMGEVFLFYYHEDKWQMAGKGTIEEKSNEDDTSYYQAVSGAGVFFEGLYPFVFVYAGKRIITGKIVDVQEAEPLANALITITSSRDTAVSGSDGTFSISIPDTLSNVRMKILHQDYYIMEKPVEFTGSETQKDIGNIFLTALSKKTLQGTVTTHNQAPVAYAEVVVTIQNKPINIIFPDVIQTKTRENGFYSIAGIPVDVLKSAVVNVITEDGYDPGFKAAIPESQTDTITLDFVMVAPLWTFQTNGNIYSSPTISDSNVYIGSCDGKLYCLNAKTGAKIWDYSTFQSLAIFATPAVDADSVYFGTLNNQFYALDKDKGEKSWIVYEVNGWPDPTENTNIISSPALDSDVLFFGSSDNAIYSYKDNKIESAPEPQWSNVKGGNITATPAYDNGRIYFGSWDGYFYAHGTSLNMNDDNYYTEKWRYPVDAPLPGRILSSPIIAGDRVFFGGGNNLEEGSGGTSVTDGDTNIYCLNVADGKKVWEYATDGAIVSKAAVVGNKLYVGSLDGNVYCLSADKGEMIWTFSTDDEVYSSPFVSNGKVYIGSNDTYLYCLDAVTGDKIWSFKTRGEVISSPKIDNGKIYFGSLDGEIYCVEE
jgi:eukaryotic-like serine/threonine-protein kinase